MTGQIDSLLEKGIEAARIHEKKRAQEILTHVIELDQYNEKAWLWLSSVVDSQSDKEVCLENALLINPDNTYAAMGLQHIRRQNIPPSSSSVLPRLAGERTPIEREWETSTPVAPPPKVRVCPRCEFHNPGWAYLCDRCGTNLRQVNLKEALSEASQPRKRYPYTLVEAWGGMLVFDGAYAFRPEIALASLGRSISALITAAVLASMFRIVAAILVPALAGEYDLRSQFASDAQKWGEQTLLLALAMLLVWVAATPLTWVGARLLGGKQGLKVHAHLVIVAVSAWTLLGAAIAVLVILTPYLIAQVGALDLPFEQVFNWVGIAMGVIGFVWLAQATREAHSLSATRGILAAIFVATLGAVLFFVLNSATGGGFADSVAKPLLVFFLPWLG
ncbi:MAG: tetratricopeptide repeat protein [Anaerolineae bacterium]|jgi:ribosomal protein L40E